MKTIRTFFFSFSAVLIFNFLMIVQAYAFSEEQKASIQTIVHEYLMENPQVIVDAYRKLQEQEHDRTVQQAKKVIPANAAKLFEASNASIAGNAKGNVTLVEFFDYQCGYCRQVAPVIKDLIAHDKNLRVIYKDFPIIDPNSEIAAKAALASHKQGKYIVFHEALIKVTHRLDEQSIMKIAESVGINTQQLKRDMQSKEIAETLAENMQLAQDLNLMGTPAFIIASHPFNKEKKYFFAPGFIDEASLKKFIAMARK